MENSKYRQFWWQITLTKILFSIIPLFILAAALYYHFSVSYTAKVMEGLRTLAANRQSSLDLFLEERISQLATLANTSTLAQLSELERRWPVGEIVAYLFRAEGLSLIHFGSAGWIEPEVAGLQPDIALLPLENPPRTDANLMRLVALLKPGLVIPHHWDDYYPPLSEMVDLHELESMLQAQVPAIKVHQPAIGERIDLARLVHSPALPNS